MSALSIQGDAPFIWPGDDTSRAPYRVYTDPHIYAMEQKNLFQRPTWNFLCLEVVSPNGHNSAANKLI